MCSSDFDRLLDLSERTGDTLIVYDRMEGNHKVVMSIDKYEDLVTDHDDFDFEDHDVRGLSEGQLIDKINRDIAVWRSNRELDDKWLKDEMIEEEIVENNFDPFEEDYMHSQDWHKAGDVLKEKHHDWEDTAGDVADEVEFPDLFSEQKEEPKEKKTQVPYAEHVNTFEDEEGLDEEPIFFEEPV
jgi:hypothetical protein